MDSGNERDKRKRRQVLAEKNQHKHQAEAKLALCVKSDTETIKKNNNK